MGEKKEWDLLIALVSNILSWLVSTFSPSHLQLLLPACCSKYEDKLVESYPRDSASDNQYQTKCISIGRPGGMEQLRFVYLKPNIVTLGYNIRSFSLPPYTPPMAIESSNKLPQDCIILHNQYFSINYADCVIRWGLYDSAKKFVGWPIVPGFDMAGYVESVPSPNGIFQKGEAVFGVTLFGAYSNRILIPSIQLRKIPSTLTMEQAAALPAVSLTALYALYISGFYPPGISKYNNKSILIHSAAGGVGSMLIQMAKLLGLHPIVGVVGNTSKVNDALQLGCSHVIDKSCENLWIEAEKICPGGFGSIMDANGVSTLKESFRHLCATGRLIVFGFHSNLPMGQDMLSPLEWLKMARKAFFMPTFDPMDLVGENKSVLGFNLSFLAEEKELVSFLFDQILVWITDGKLQCPKITSMSMDRIAEAHQYLQSGKSIGKIVMHTK